MKNKLQYRPGKETHNPEQKRSCFLRQRNSVITTVVIFLSSFCLNLLALNPPEGVNYSTEIICAFGLHAEYEEEYIGLQQEPKRKIKNKIFYFSTVRPYAMKNHNWEESFYYYYIILCNVINKVAPFCFSLA